MMQKEQARYHAVRGRALALLLAVATLTGLIVRGQVVEQRNRNPCRWTAGSPQCGIPEPKCQP